MILRVLGPLEVEVDGVPVDVGGPSSRPGTSAERRMSTLLTEPERAAAEIIGRDLSWPDMISLFTRALPQEE